jgi:uncharacterized protein with PQ loop repeat
MVDFLGFIASVLLILSSVPQLICTLRKRDVSGLSLGTLLFWFWGVVLMGIYVYLTSKQMPLLLNYGFNSVVVGINVIFFFKYRKKL